MAYEKQSFYKGQKLQASQLDAMEDGIIEAERLAMEGIAGAGTKLYLHEIEVGGPRLVLVSTRKDPYLLNSEIITATDPTLGIRNGVIVNQSDLASLVGPAIISDVNSDRVWQMQSWDGKSTFTITQFIDKVTEL